MRILFVPLDVDVLSHQIPLLVLSRMLTGPSVSTAFLLPRHSHGLLRQLGAEVLDVEHDSFLHTEIRAYKRFAPDVVVDDTSFSTGLATTMAQLPRVTIQRKGLFPGDPPRNPQHQHSLGVRGIERVAELTKLGLTTGRALPDFFNAPVKIVPGVRSIEVLPPALADDPSYVFAGPLLMEDFLVSHGAPVSEGGRAAAIDIGELKNFTPLEEFFEANRGRRIVYLTVGLVLLPASPVFDCIRFLLDRGIAVVTNINFTPPEGQGGLYFRARYLPMHLVCSRVDLAIHHCGSGAYHYPILHGLPSVTIGSGCYDRDDVAVRLEELGTSVHVPPPQECEDFVGRFKAAVDRYFDEDGGFMRERRARVAVLKGEVERAQRAFDFEGLLREVVARAQYARPAVRRREAGQQPPPR